MPGSISEFSGGQFYPNHETTRRRWVTTQQHLLDEGKIEKLVAKPRKLSPDTPELEATIRKEANHFERNAERMRYPKFRAQNLFVGSGVIEAGCKTVIGSRLKRSGMLWTVRGANAVIALRCCRHAANSTITGLLPPGLIAHPRSHTPAAALR